MLLLWASGSSIAAYLYRQGLGRELDHLPPWYLGIAFWTLVAFALSSLGAFSRITVTLVLGLMVITFFFAKRPAALKPTLPMARCLDEDPRTQLIKVSWVLILVIALLPFLVIAIHPVVYTDSDVYHLTIPRQIHETGGFRAQPLSVLWNWPSGTELLFALGMLAKDYVLAKLLSFGIGLLLLYAIFVAVRRFYAPEAAPLAISFFIANGVVMFQLKAAYVDVAYALFLLGGLLFMLEALDKERSEGSAPLLLSGICCGLMAASKITGLFGAATIGSLYGEHLWRGIQDRRLKDSLRPFASFFCLPVLILLSPWIIKSAVFTGNPTYPFLYGIFGGPDWSPDLAMRFRDWQRSIGMGREPLDYLLLPFRVALEGGPGYHRFDGKIGFQWILLGPVAIIGGFLRPRGRRVLWVVGLYFLIWALTSQQMRFLIPILPPLAILAAGGLWSLADGLPRSERYRRLASGTLHLGAAVLLMFAVWPYLGLAREAAEEVQSALTDDRNLELLAADPVFLYINENVPRDAVVLFVGANRSFFCHRDFLADSMFEASQIEAWLARAQNPNELRELLRTRGVTHVLLGQSPYAGPPSPLLLRFLRDPNEAHPVMSSPAGGYRLFALR